MSTTCTKNFSITIKQGASTTVLSLDPATAVEPCAQVTYLATVTGAYATPTGSVEFYYAGVLIDTVALNGAGQASTDYGFGIPKATGVVTAKYLGDSNYSGSQDEETQTVNYYPSSITINSAYIAEINSHWGCGYTGILPLADPGNVVYYEECPIHHDFIQLDTGQTGHGVFSMMVKGGGFMFEAVWETNPNSTTSPIGNYQWWSGDPVGGYPPAVPSVSITP